MPVTDRYTFVFNRKGISKDNEKVFNRQGRFFLSKRFKDFEKALQADFEAQKPADFKMYEDCELCVNLNFTFTSKVHCDLFNLPKSCCDAFNMRIWKDDRMIKSGSVDINYGDKEEIRLEVFKL